MKSDRSTESKNETVDDISFQSVACRPYLMEVQRSLRCVGGESRIRIPASGAQNCHAVVTGESDRLSLSQGSAQWTRRSLPQEIDNHLERDQRP